jgi:hypothetical protein
MPGLRRGCHRLLVQATFRYRSLEKSAHWSLFVFSSVTAHVPDHLRTSVPRDGLTLGSVLPDPICTLDPERGGDALVLKQLGQGTLLVLVAGPL